MAQIEELLSAFGEAMTGTAFALDAKGVCELGFHDGLRLSIEPEPGTPLVHLYSRLASLPARNAETVYGKLLAANLFGKGADGAWFAIDPQEEAIMLNRVLDTDGLDAERFGETVTAFMDAVEHWSRELEGHDFAEPVGEEVAAPPPPLGGGMPFILRG